MSELSNLKATVKRQSTPGSLLLILCAALLFGPRAWDTVVGEPWVDNNLSVIINSGGDTVVEDYIFTKDVVHGSRANTVENTDGEVVCSTEHYNTWQGERRRFWHLPAFVSCAERPANFRVCSRFTISSPSGRTRAFGPFCSPYTLVDEAPVANRGTGAQ